MKDEFLKIIDILGVITFAISGVSAAMQRKLDVFGIFIIAFITALGGGTLRDMMTGELPVSWMKNVDYCLIIFITTIITLFFTNVIAKFPKMLFVFDSLGLGFFTVLGVQKGIVLGLHPGICIALGVVTGCFGGVIRDIALNNIPVIFRKEVYATASLAGAGLYYLLINKNFQSDWADVICISFIFLVRFIVVRYKISLPDIYKKE